MTTSCSTAYPAATDANLSTPSAGCVPYLFTSFVPGTITVSTGNACTTS